MKMADVKKDARNTAAANALVNFKAVLYWSEFYNGQWQSPMTSDPLDPVDLGWFAPQGSTAFDRNSLRLRSDEQDDGNRLRITVYGYSYPKAFLLYNTHSLPQQDGVAPAAVPPPYGRKRWFDTTPSTFTVDYDYAVPDVPDDSLSRDVLTARTSMLAVQPNHLIQDLWDAPFFFGDRQYVFYVTTTQAPVWVRDYGGIGVSNNPAKFKIPPLIVEQLPPGFPPKYWGDGGLIGPDPGVIDPAPMQQLVNRGLTIRQGIAVSTPVQFGDVQLGPAGALDVANVRAE
jgi:hypothetical protein